MNFENLPDIFQDKKDRKEDVTAETIIDETIIDPSRLLDYVSTLVLRYDEAKRAASSTEIKLHPEPAITENSIKTKLQKLKEIREELLKTLPTAIEFLRIDIKKQAPKERRQIAHQINLFRQKLAEVQSEARDEVRTPPRRSSSINRGDLSVIAVLRYRLMNFLRKILD